MADTISSDGRPEKAGRLGGPQGGPQDLKPLVDFNFDPIKLFWLLASYKWLILCFLVAGTILGLLYSSAQTPRYLARVSMEIVGSRSKAVSDFEVVSEDRAFRGTALGNVPFKIKTHSLAQRVVYELDLTEKPAFYQPQGRSFSIKGLIKRAMGRPSTPRTEALTAEQRESRAIRTVLSGLEVVSKRKTSIVDLNFTHPDPTFAMLVANQLADSYIDLSIDQNLEASSKVRTFVAEQVENVKNELGVAERKLNEYAQAIDFVDISEEPTLLANRIASVNDAMNKAAQETLSIQLIVDQIKSGRAESLPEVINSRPVQLIKAKIAENETLYQDRLGTYKADFPEMVSLRTQIKELRKQLESEIQIIADSYFIRLDQSQARERGLREELERQAKSQQEFRENFVEYTILKREVDSKRAQYAAMIGKLNSVGVGAEYRDARAIIIERAQKPRGAVSPNPAFNAVVFSFIGLLFSAMMIYILEALRNTFQTPDQVEDELGKPILGIIPYTEDTDTPWDIDDSSSFVESYRSLRTAIQFSELESGGATLSITSSEPSEGKSITAFKLAQGFAALNRKVLLIEADLRRPKLHKWFGRANTLGLSSVLSGDVENVADVIADTQVPNLTFLGAGGIPDNPADLLSSARMGKLLHQAAKDYDLIIIDSPPVMGLADAPILARSSTATVFVVATHQASRNSVKTALRRLQETGANIIGLALTKFSVEKHDYSYAYSYMQKSYYTYDARDGEEA